MRGALTIWFSLLAAWAAAQPAQGQQAAPSTLAAAAAPTGQHALRFVSCPLYRDADAGRKSGCWLAEDPASGQRYDLQRALTKPQLNQPVLVEGWRRPAQGNASAAPSACGGEVLHEARVSVLPGRCPSAILPAEGHAGSPFVLPQSVMTANHLAQPQPAPPFATRQFEVHFDHGDDYLLYQHAEVRLQEAVRLARLGGAVRIAVVGHAATVPQQVSGLSLAEPSGLAQARADMVAEALVRLGWPRQLITVAAEPDPAPSPGTPIEWVAASQRRASFTVVLPERPVRSASYPPGTPEFERPAAPAWVPATQPVGGGPHPAIMDSVPGLPQHTVYRPADLSPWGAASGRRLPVLAWANGACVNVGNRFRWFLSEIASHGYLVIASGPIGPAEVEGLAGAGNMRGQPAPDSPAGRALAEGRDPRDPVASARGLSRAETTHGQLLQALDWAQAADQRAGSPWHGRIDVRRSAVMGQSCGGLQAIAAAADPRVRTLGVWNSGVLDDPALAETISGSRVTKSDIERLRLPMLYVTGEPSDVAFKNAQDDVARIQHAPVLWAWRERTGHGGTYREPGGGAFAPLAVDWLNWQLKGDASAGARFDGPGCTWCTAPGWHLQRKLNPAAPRATGGPRPVPGTAAAPPG